MPPDPGDFPALCIEPALLKPFFTQRSKQLAFIEALYSWLCQIYFYKVQSWTCFIKHCIDNFNSNSKKKSAETGIAVTNASTCVLLFVVEEDKDGRRSIGAEVERQPAWRCFDVFELVLIYFISQHIAIQTGLPRHCNRNIWFFDGLCLSYPDRACGLICSQFRQ